MRDHVSIAQLEKWAGRIVSALPFGKFLFVKIQFCLNRQIFYSTKISHYMIVVRRGLKMYLVLGRRERLFCWVISMLRLVDLYK